MINLKKFEKDLSVLYEAGKIPFPVHFQGGNESQLCDIFDKIYVNDWVFATHRNHYHALLHGYPVRQLKEDIIKYGSMNVYRKKFFTSGIVGGCLPIAVGVAMGIKMRGDKEHVWIFVGDMAAMTGMFEECTRYASWYAFPITFVVEDNGMSVDTPTQETWGEDWYGCVRQIEDIKYEYKREYPHQGTGVYVSFDGKEGTF